MIQLDNVHKAFGPKLIYRGLDLDVEEGETHVIIGRSGEGKSVLLKHICGLIGPDNGRVIVDGREISIWDKESIHHVRERVTMVFQMGALFDSLTVRQNVGFALDQRKKRSTAEIDRLCQELLEEVNLPDTGHLLPAELSGGMRKRVGLARGLAAEPKIILYDEPTTGLDPVTSEVINELIVRTNHRHGMTAIVVTHDMKSAYKIADRISMLYEGRIIFTGTPEEIRRTSDPVVQQFICGEARGPITQTESEDVQRLSTAMVDRSLLVRRLKSKDHE
ncbi:ATP-binding cassette domain-containing protein [bacterium]|nr:ATP-binding cassette domain-containing protein [bacterium]